MRNLGLIVIAACSVALAAPATAAPASNSDPAPVLRYSVEDGPSLPPSADTQAPPQAAPIRYSVQRTPLPPPSVAPAAFSPGERVEVTGDRDYQLGPGDKVHITVYGESDLSGDFEISGSGQLAFPLIGDVRAAGLTAPALGEALAAQLAGRYLKDPRVAIEITTYRPFYIVGEVNKPGQYPYVNGMTAMNAIALAGGFTPRATESYVYVRHEGETRETQLAADEPVAIRPGDVVRVSESGFWSVMSVLQPVASLAGIARYGLP